MLMLGTTSHANNDSPAQTLATPLPDQLTPFRASVWLLLALQFVQIGKSSAPAPKCSFVSV